MNSIRIGGVYSCRPDSSIRLVAGAANENFVMLERKITPPPPEEVGGGGGDAVFGDQTAVEGGAVRIRGELAGPGIARQRNIQEHSGRQHAARQEGRTVVGAPAAAAADFVVVSGGDGGEELKTGFG